MNETKVPTSRLRQAPPRDAETLARSCRELLEAELPAAALPLIHYLAHLERVRDGAGSAPTALLLGECHLRLGHLRQAEEAFVTALARAGGSDPWSTLQAHVLLAEVLALAHHYPRAASSLEAAEAILKEHPEPYLDARRLALRADLARLQGQYGEAAAHLAQARRLAAGSDRPALHGRLSLAAAQLAWAQGEADEAAAALREAVERVEPAGVKHLLAEIYLQCGVFAGEQEIRGATPEATLPHPAAHYLARAQELFAESGSLRDLERLRHHFRLYGRRATDKVADAVIAKRSEEVFLAHLELARHADGLLPQLVAAEPDDGSASREETVWPLLVGFHGDLHSRLVALSRSGDRLVDAAHAAVVERDRLQDLLDGVRRLTTEVEGEALTREVVQLVVAVLDADRVVLALVSRRGELTARERAGRAGPDEYSWRILAEQVRRTGAPALSDGEPRGLATVPALGTEKPALGHAMAVPILEAGEVEGVIFVDRQERGGVFSRRDLKMLEVIAAQVAALLERQRMTWSLRMAARVRETTMEAISDGVVAISTEGEIRSLNSAACRLLGVSKAEAEGRRGVEVAGLRELLGGRADPEEREGHMVRLSGGEAVVGVRRIRDDAGQAAGTLITLTALRRAQRAAQRIVGARARYTFGDILGSSPVFLEQIHLAEAAARSDAGVLITGESGTGKEVMAQAIHNGSSRASGPFVGINCAAIPRELLESELFGYEEGAFTGAKRGGQPGKFELAEGGTVLLDEIGDMPLEMQAKLLRVLQERRFQRVGGVREYVLDARIVATTNRDLEELASEQRFRHDLLFRLQVIHLHLPPLRERREDVPLFVEAFLRRSAERLGKHLTKIAPHVMEAFVDYGWPGNIRELEYIVESEANLADADAEILDRMPAALRPAQRRRRETLVGLPVGESRRSRASSATFNLQDVEQEIFLAALREHHGNVPAVANALGVSRGTVYNKLRKYNVDLTRFRNGS